jgi:hypothetical protein
METSVTAPHLTSRAALVERAHLPPEGRIEIDSDSGTALLYFSDAGGDRPLSRNRRVVDAPDPDPG